MIIPSKEHHQLSKSTIMMGQQCFKRLWLHKNRPDLRPDLSVSQAMTFKRGIDVGKLARQLFPGGKDASSIDPFHYQESVQQTFDWVQAGERTIYEAAFQYDGAMAALDILVNRDGKWYGYEVKSSTSIKEQYLMDAALQYYVMSGAGLAIEDISIIFINTSYIRKGELELKQLFSEVSIKKEVIALQTAIPRLIQKCKETLKFQTEPIMDIGTHCKEPYECEFIDHCWKHIPEISVFDLTGMWLSKKLDLYSRGIIEFDQLPEAYVLTSAQDLQVRAYRDNQTHIDIEKIKGWLQQLKYPLYFMDFETFMPAVPLYENSHPYQHISFQFSVHVQERPTSECQHYYYLGEPDTDPRPEFLKHLLETTKGKGTILAYNMSFEASRLKELQGDFPNLSKNIDELLNRLVDLMEPFHKKWYYSPEMNGSYSIKSVLPALIPELSYKDLEIGEGGAAMSAFEGLLSVHDAAEKITIRNALLEYCKLDTLAMVRILENLTNCVI